MGWIMVIALRNAHANQVQILNEPVCISVPRERQQSISSYANPSYG